jgi:transcriptional regulator with XRE-family HTH domain
VVNSHANGARRMDDFASRLAALMAERGLGVLALARRVPCDKALISRLAAGRQQPSAQIARRLDDILEVGGALAALRGASDSHGTPGRPSGPEPDDGGQDDDMNRRELLRIFSVAGALMSIGGTPDALDWERLGFLAAGQHPVTAADADELAALNRHLWRVFMLARSKRLVYPLVRDQLAVMTDSLQRTNSPAVFGQLCGAAADLFQLAGEILLDQTRYTDAAHCYTLAATAARQAPSPDLWACALTRHAFISIWEEHPRPAAGMLDLATALARRGDSSLSTRHWVAAVQAEVFAGIGDRHACERALAMAEEVTGLSGDYHNGGWLRFDGSRLAEQRGACYTALGRPDLAEAALLAALDGNLTPRRRGVVLVDLAMTGVQRRDTGQITAYASAAVDIATTTKSGVVIRELAALRGALGPFLADSRIRLLGDRIAAIAGGR